MKYVNFSLLFLFTCSNYLMLLLSLSNVIIYKCINWLIVSVFKIHLRISVSVWSFSVINIISVEFDLCWMESNNGQGGENVERAYVARVSILFSVLYFSLRPSSMVEQIGDKLSAWLAYLRYAIDRNNSAIRPHIN